ncbi:helix-turn-helix transcriptional regulator [Chitinophaga nivalis]|uniref:Transcriptional regulator n=1 Tax=Chitinophaga nivalis TaxID=2991709 RepID=A0ABT3IR30_9BACT|nr:metalloregulator ArsR/SmtB family transcription factor [Chitinophaga nivalis]MCW3464136.1 transcriptional regulator [Chitinophaga nivalis]MCW3486174.1 transcriptional regulator [Chitinophaga nivalis]
MINEVAENEKAIRILKTRGPLPLQEIAADLKITTEGARFQLLKLANEGLVQATTVAKGRGRPQQIWSLTAAGNARFPDRHQELSLKLLQSMREILGAEGFRTVLEANEKAGVRQYSQEMSDAADLESKVRALTDIRNREGYMAEYTKTPEGFLLVENHCPIYVAAKDCNGLCGSELAIFQAVLGAAVTVTRAEHILSGSRRCAYLIQPQE